MGHIMGLNRIDRMAALAITVFTTSSFIVAQEIDIGASEIVGGTVAVEGSFTSDVALTDLYPPKTGKRVFICGGSLLTKWTVLTAAHCIDGAFEIGDGTLSSNLRGRVGTNEWQTGGQEFSFCDNVTHPLHDPDTLKYDIGLLYTSSAVIFSALVQPIKLDFDFVHAGVKCVVAGWGRIMKDGVIPNKLHQLLVTTVDGSSCIKQVAQAGVEYNLTLPAVNPQLEICVINSPDHGVCSGDSGGALIRSDKGTMVGHVDWGIPCATGAPDVFVRLSAMKDWLLQYIIEDDFPQRYYDRPRLGHPLCHM